MNANLLPTGSAYFLTQQTQQPERHTLTVLVGKIPGVEDAFVFGRDDNLVE